MEKLLVVNHCAQILCQKLALLTVMVAYGKDVLPYSCLHYLKKMQTNGS